MFDVPDSMLGRWITHVTATIGTSLPDRVSTQNPLVQNAVREVR
jgi:hypothetical protein